MNRSQRLQARIKETLSDLGQIPEPAIAFNHCQPATGKVVGWRIPYVNRLKKRRKKRKGK